MNKEKETKKYKYDIKIRSKIHPSIFHIIKINLKCYEKLTNINLYCNEKMPDENSLQK